MFIRITRRGVLFSFSFFFPFVLFYFIWEGGVFVSFTLSSPSYSDNKPGLGPLHFKILCLFWVQKMVDSSNM